VRLPHLRKAKFVSDRVCAFCHLDMRAFNDNWCPDCPNKKLYLKNAKKGKKANGK
jgi:hypothetical protein